MRALFIGGPYNNEVSTVVVGMRELKYIWRDPQPVGWPPLCTEDKAIFETGFYRLMPYIKRTKRHRDKYGRYSRTLEVYVYVDHSLSDAEADRQVNSLWPSSPYFYCEPVFKQEA